MSPPRKNVAVWLNEAQRLMGSNPDAALACVERALEMEPKNAHAWFYKASVFHRAGRTEDALAAFRKTAELDGGTAPAINGVVVQLKRLGRLEEALEVADSCRDKSHFFLASGRADIFKEMGNPSRALAEHVLVEPLAKTDPEKALFHYNKACFECLVGRLDDALTSLPKAIALEAKYKQSAPKDPDFTLLRDDPRFLALTRPGAAA